MRILIVADDLTGALDTAAPFAALGWKTLVSPFENTVAKAVAARPDVLAVSSNSRQLDEADAVSELLNQLAGIDAELVCKKVDSRLQCHPGIETASSPVILASSCW